MTRNSSIRLKASFLLAVFALNTVVGFACSVGVDMGFNSKHHGSNEATGAFLHIHKDGKRHVHQEKKEKHDHSKQHKHNGANDHHKSSSNDDDCCTDTVKQFHDLDKAVPNSLNLVHPIFPSAFIAAFCDISLLPYADVVKDIKPFVRNYHPPIPDIRIAIQSFQI